MDLPEAGPTAATIVWRDGNAYGCEFAEPITAAAASAARLRSDPARPVPTGAPESGNWFARIAAAVVLAGLAMVLLAAAMAAPWLTAGMLGVVATLLVVWGVALVDGIPNLKL